MQFSLPWGTGRLELPLPAGWRVAELSPAARERSSYPSAELVRAALDGPLGARPFSKRDLSDERVTLVIDLRQRPEAIPALFRQVVRRLLEAGASPDRVRVLFSIGCGEPPLAEEFPHLLGWAGALPFQARCTNWHDDSLLVFLGKTHRRTPVYLDRWLDDTDLVVVLGASDVDPFFGFGGGLRAISPGAAGRETHEAYPDLLAAIHDPWLSGVGSPANPLAADADEAARMCPAEILVVTAVLDRHGQLAHAVFGEPQHVAEAVASLLDERFGVEVDGAADVVVTSSTPFDANLREGLRAVAAAAGMVADGGTVLACLKCDSREQALIATPRFVPNAVLRLFLETVGNVRVLKYVRKTWHDLTPEDVLWAWLVLTLLRRRRLVVYGPNLDADTARQLGPVEWFPDLHAAFLRVSKSHPSAHAYLLEQGALTWRRRERRQPGT